MTNDEKLKEIEEALERASKDIFKPRPKEIEEELRKKDTYGNPDNLLNRNEEE